MNNEYRVFFGFTREPFPVTLNTRDILQTKAVSSVKNRFDYAVRLGGISIVTGDVGSGKSTAVRFAAESLHSSEYKVFYITATSGSIIELYRQFAEVLGLAKVSGSKAVMTALIKNEIADLVLGKKFNTVLIIDEASLLRMEVFAELHTLVQFHKDSQAWLPLILAGQSVLVDKLRYRTSLPIASRVIARSHLEGIDKTGMEAYLMHHLKLAGIDRNLFSDQAITAIHQGSGGLLRKANHLARGALIAAASTQSDHASADHVRMASSEVF